MKAVVYKAPFKLAIENVDDPAIEQPGDFAIELFFSELRVADEIPRSGGDEAERIVPVIRIRVERIARELFLDEPGVRLVPI